MKETEMDNADTMVFPQDRATGSKPNRKVTMIEVIEGGRTAEEMFSLLAAAFPKATIVEAYTRNRRKDGFRELF